MPKISVIIPVYNTEKYLEKCLDSIINQTYQDFEIVIINDGSIDNSQNIIEKYLDKYQNKIKCINKENGGLSSARNYGIEIARGDYIIFVDSDDYIKKDLFEQLLPYIQKDIDLVKYKLIKVSEEYKELERVDGPSFDEVTGEEGFNKLVFNDVLLEPACLYLYKRDIFIKNNLRFLENTYHEDFGLVPIILLYTNSIVSINFYGYYYLQANNSITRNEDYTKTIKRANDLLIHYDNMKKAIENLNIKQKTKENMYLYYTNAIFDNLKKLQKKEKKKYVQQIHKRKLLNNIKIINLKRLIKRMILYIYLKIENL
mgnify:FL=1